MAQSSVAKAGAAFSTLLCLLAFFLLFSGMGAFRLAPVATLGNIRCTPDDYTEHMASLNLSNGSSSANGSSDTRNLTEADCQSHSLGNLTHEQVVWRRYVTSTYISPLFDCPAAGSLVLSEPKSYAFQPNTMVRYAVVAQCDSEKVFVQWQIAVTALLVPVACVWANHALFMSTGSSPTDSGTYAGGAASVVASASVAPAVVTLTMGLAMLASTAAGNEVYDGLSPFSSFISCSLLLTKDVGALHAAGFLCKENDIGFAAVDSAYRALQTGIAFSFLACLFFLVLLQCCSGQGVGAEEGGGFCCGGAGTVDGVGGASTDGKGTGGGKMGAFKPPSGSGGGGGGSSGGMPSGGGGGMMSNEPLGLDAPPSSSRGGGGGEIAFIGSAGPCKPVGSGGAVKSGAVGGGGGAFIGGSGPYKPSGSGGISGLVSSNSAMGNSSISGSGGGSMSSSSLPPKGDRGGAGSGSAGSNRDPYSSPAAGRGGGASGYSSTPPLSDAGKIIMTAGGGDRSERSGGGSSHSTPGHSHGGMDSSLSSRMGLGGSRAGSASPVGSTSGQSRGGGGMKSFGTTQFKATSAYHSVDSAHLALRIGDVVEVYHREEDGEWMRGVCQGQSGLFPADRVIPVGGGAI